MAAEQHQPAAQETMSFKFRHPDGEQHTVTVTRKEVANQLPDFLFEKLSGKICQCEPIGETNVVDCSCCDYVDDFQLVSEEPASTTAPWRPAKCPITGRLFFMWIEHPTKGMVPTYGGPLDSYTLAEADDEGTFQCERYDHDAGAWCLDTIEWIDLKLVGGQSGIGNEGDLDKLRSHQVELLEALTDCVAYFDGRLDSEKERVLCPRIRTLLEGLPFPCIEFEDTEQRRKLSKPIPLTRGDDVEVFLLHREPSTEDERGAWYPAKFVALCLSKVSPEPIVQRAGSMPIYGTWNGVRLPAGKKLVVPTQQKAEKRKPFMFAQLHAGDVMDWTQDPNLADTWQEDGHTVAKLFTEASQ
ncbi:TPA: hypothetical protein L4559_003497 [Pseudomonas aeruginosa]|nr:hypothetical protein [Pseudomonas aeruginosa]